MASFKCKMCGGSLEITAGATVIECEYCGTQQTLPKLDDDKRANMYDRANHFRRNNEFDKAMGIYEQILNEDNTDAEAYWSIVLCRYGIEYVEDPSSHNRIPTVNRAQYTSIFDDDNYKSALQYADGYQRAIYEAEAKAINEIQKGILAISQNEEPFDVFICYKETDSSGRRTPDSVLANDLYHQLTQEGFKVFFARITLEDKLGSAYEPYIFAALNSAKVMVVLGTKPEYFNAVWVKNEWSRYLAIIKQGQKKMLIPAYKDMDPYDLPEEFSHLQAQDMSKLGFMQDLIRGIKKIAQADTPITTVVKETVIGGGNANTAPLLKRAFMFLEDGDWNSANEYCEKVLDIDPECAEAYLGKLMAELRVKNQEALEECSDPFDSNNLYKKAIRFADETLKESLKKCIDHIHCKDEIKQREVNRLYDDWHVLHLRFVSIKEDEITSNISNLNEQLKDSQGELERIEGVPIIAPEKARELENLKCQLKEIQSDQKKITDQKNAAESQLESVGFFEFSKKKIIKRNIIDLDGQLCKLSTSVAEITDRIKSIKQLLSKQYSLEEKKKKLHERKRQIDKLKEEIDVQKSMSNDFIRYKSLYNKLIEACVFDKLGSDKQNELKNADRIHHFSDYNIENCILYVLECSMTACTYNDIYKKVCDLGKTTSNQQIVRVLLSLNKRGLVKRKQINGETYWHTWAV